MSANHHPGQPHERPAPESLGVESRRAGGVSLRVTRQSAERGDGAAHLLKSEHCLATQRYPEANASGSAADDFDWPVEADKDGRTWLEKLGQDGEVGAPVGDFADAEPLTV